MNAYEKPSFTYDIEDRRYINIGKHCSLRCTFCPKNRGSLQVHHYDLTLDKQPTAQQLIAALGDLSTVKEVIFCGYSEPTLRLKVLLEVAHVVKQQSIPVRVNTDGLGNLVNKRNILPELADCVDTLSVSMNAHEEALYNSHCNPGISGSYLAMLNFLKWAPRYINNVTATAIDGLPGVNMSACREIAQQLGVDFKARKLDQVG